MCNKKRKALHASCFQKLSYLFDKFASHAHTPSNFAHWRHDGHVFVVVTLLKVFPKVCFELPDVALDPLHDRHVACAHMPLLQIDRKIMIPSPLNFVWILFPLVYKWNDLSLYDRKTLIYLLITCWWVPAGRSRILIVLWYVWNTFSRKDFLNKFPQIRIFNFFKHCK